MPPEVEAEIVVLEPVGLCSLQPVDAVGVASLHLEDVRDRVDGPRILRIQVHSLTAHTLGHLVFSALLQAERQHPQDKSVAYHRRVPGVESPAHDIAHVGGIASPEMEQLGQLDVHRISRMVDGNSVERCQRFAGFLGEKEFSRGHVPLLPFGCVDRGLLAISSES